MKEEGRKMTNSEKLLRELKYIRFLVVTYLTPDEVGIFLAEFFLFPIFYFIAVFLINLVIQLITKVNTIPDVITKCELWIFLPFYFFIIGYFLIVSLIKGCKKGVKMANANKWVTPVVIGSLVVVGLFYWFQIRPSKIKQECNSWAGNQSGFDRRKNEITKNSYERYYISCTREKGL
jgi:hypothetical protein